MIRRLPKAPEIVFKKRNKWGVDIVTPVYGQPEFLRAMLSSLLNTDPGLPDWTLTLVDDRGPDVEDVYKEVSSHPRVRIVHNETNLGFAGSNNAGFRLGKNPLLLMLNSDIKIIHEQWLAAMAKPFDDPTVGIVGAKLIFFEEADPLYKKSDFRPPGKIQHAGVAFNLVGNPYHVYQGWDRDHERVSHRRDYNAVTGACLMVRRSLYNRLGGLDEDYRTGNFEDVQLCVQVRRSGYRVVYQPDAALYHFAGGSGNSATAKFNLQLFHVKCRGMIEYDEWRTW